MVHDGLPSGHEALIGDLSGESSQPPTETHRASLAVGFHETYERQVVDDASDQLAIPLSAVRQLSHGQTRGAGRAGIGQCGEDVLARQRPVAFHAHEPSA